MSAEQDREDISLLVIIMCLMPQPQQQQQQQVLNLIDSQAPVPLIKEPLFLAFLVVAAMAAAWFAAEATDP